MRRLLSALVSTLVLGTAASATDYGKILPIGDSITLGDVGPSGGYRKPLETDLLAEGVSFSFVGSQVDGAGMAYPYHEGHNGWNLGDLLNGRATEPTKGSAAAWVAAESPNVVLLMAGTNEPIQQTQAELRAKYVALLDSIWSARVTAQIVMSPFIPSKNSATGKGAFEQAAYGTVTSLVADLKGQGRPIYLADAYTGFDTATDLVDNYHPNARGDQKIANAFRSTLLGEVAPVPEPGTVAALGVGALAVLRRRRR